MSGRARKAGVCCSVTKYNPTAGLGSCRERGTRHVASPLQHFPNAQWCGASRRRPGGDRDPDASMGDAGVRRVQNAGRKGASRVGPGLPDPARRGARLPSSPGSFPCGARRVPGALISPPPQRLCRRGRPGLPPLRSLPSPPAPARRPPPAARAFVWPGGALGASRAGNWRPEEANGPARPPLMSGRSRGEGAAGRGAGEGASLVAPLPRLRPDGRPGPGRPLPGCGGDRRPRGHPPLPPPGGPRRAPITLRPCGGLRLPPGRPRVPGDVPGTGRAGGRAAEVAPWGHCRAAGDPSGPGGPRAGALGEGDAPPPPASDASVLT